MQKIRVLIGKPGLDGHDRGAKLIARMLRDSGMEVIYTGLRQSPEMIVETALQEDVDVIGLSILSGAHNSLVPRIMALMEQNEMADIPIFLGGIFPPDDVILLKQQGVWEVFGPGSRMSDIAASIRDAVGGHAISI